MWLCTSCVRRGPGLSNSNKKRALGLWAVKFILTILLRFIAPPWENIIMFTTVHTMANDVAPGNLFPGQGKMVGEGPSAASPAAAVRPSDSEKILIRVNGSGVDETFKIKKTASLGRLLQPLATNLNCAARDVEFVFEGATISPSQKIEDLLVEEETMLNIGCRVNRTRSDRHKIKICDPYDNESFFLVKETTPMQKVMKAWARRQNVTLDSVRFLFDGDRVRDTDTIASFELEEGEKEIIIDVIAEQQGGYFN